MSVITDTSVLFASLCSISFVASGNAPKTFLIDVL